MPTTVTLERVDWEQLRLAKAMLVLKYWSEQQSPVWGIINFIDHVQDQAVAAGVPEREVFGASPDYEAEDIGEAEAEA